VSTAVTTDALLLRAVDYRDADRILTLFTHSLGIVSAVARGAKASKRRFAGVLEPYLVLRVELEPSRGELMTLKRAELGQSFPGILADLARMEVAGAALALVRDAHPARVPDAPLFVNMLQYLTIVDVAGDPERSTLLSFAMRVLALSGMAPRLDACGRSGEPVPPEKPAYFDPALGAVVSRRHGGGPFLLPATVRACLLEAQTDAWVGAARATWDPEHLRIARAALAAFVSTHLGKELAARLFP
jgi:DNA repair protein RecO (recombination protein O)